MVLFIYSLWAPPVFNLRWLYALGCAISSHFGVDSLSWCILFPFVGSIFWGGCWGSQCAYVYVDPWRTSWCALWPTIFNLGAGTVSHHTIYFFSAKILTSCCKYVCFLSPICLISVACVGFPKNSLYLWLLLWWRLLLSWREFWLIVEKNKPFLIISLPLSLGYITCKLDSHSRKFQCKTRVLHEITTTRAFLVSHG